MTTVTHYADYLVLHTDNQDWRFHAVWLRDNALDAATRSSDNGQRLITLLDQPANCQIEQAQIADTDLLVHFVDDDTCYRYPLTWLEANRYDKIENQQRQNGWLASHLQTWGKGFAVDDVRGNYQQLIADDESLCQWLAGIDRYGFAIAEGLPCDNPDALFILIERFGFVRETNYGRVFEVRAEIQPKNLAYTGLGLQAHTDNPYRDPVPTLQVLSCIENTAEGGESILVDGFHAALQLKAENPVHFDLLSRYSANFCYAGDATTDLRSKRPMIELDADGELIGVRFNNRSAAPFTHIPFEQMAAYYAAYRHFAEIIERDDSEIAFRLQAGELFIVDNTRILHSRNAFSAGGSRHLRGCYVDKDGLRSRLLTLSQPRKTA